MKELSIRIRVDEVTKKNIEKNAKLVGMSISGYLRYLNTMENIKNTDYLREVIK